MQTGNCDRRIAAVANAAAYEGLISESYIDGAPHIKHKQLRDLYARQVLQVYERAVANCAVPTVLDLGAGEGSVTLPFLELGCRVVAVDIAEGQLKRLESRCSVHSERLELKFQDLIETLVDTTRQYDIIVVNSLLHHIPDYSGLIRSALARLTPGGQMFSFQDPMRYSTASKASRMFGSLSYLLWRLGKKDVFAGVGRWMRRRRGVYLADSTHDNAEYHVIRDGVDQDAITALCAEAGFKCEVTTYFSTQSGLMQPIGSSLGVRNTFSMVAYRRHSN